MFLIKTNTLIMLAFMLLTAACSYVPSDLKENEPVKSTTSPQKVTVSILEINDFPMQTISNGLLESAATVELFFEESGTLDHVYFHNGDKVSQGDLLASLVNTRQLLDLQKAEATLKETESELRSLVLGFGSAMGDTSSVEHELLQLLKSQSGFTMAALNLKSTRMNVESTFLKAPIKGLVSGVTKQEHQQILNNEPFCTLLNDDKFIAVFTVIESELSKIKSGQKVKVYPIAYDSLYITGTIVEIDPMVDKNGLIHVKALVDNPKYQKKATMKLLAGMNIKVVVEEVKANQLFIPKSALVLRSGKKVVFSYHGGLAKWNYVETGAENSNSYIITKGLTPGDTIITQGALNLAHEAKVVLSGQEERLK